MLQPILSKNWLLNHHRQSDVDLMNLPERVIQFGTGVLLRGLPDFYINQANKSGDFNGRVVVVKSTSSGVLDDFVDQDYLYTHLIRGISNGKVLEQNIVNSSISRILAAQEQWNEVLNCAQNSNINIVISNTTERGLVYQEELIEGIIPNSFPNKLLSYLYVRYITLGSQPKADIIILPTELVEYNGNKLKDYIVRGAKFNHFSSGFLAWLEMHAFFCNTLVDRIVPGKPNNELKVKLEDELGYQDECMIMSEPFHLWAIEGGQKVKDMLSFARNVPEIKIVENINLYKELKLRLLNATHILSCGLAVIEGFETVSESLNDHEFNFKVEKLIDDIKISIPMEISKSEIDSFASSVIERFKNPYIEHLWSSILLNYTEKMKIRAIPLMDKYFKKCNHHSDTMMVGLASYFYISIPDLEKDGVYFKNLNNVNIKLNDSFSSHLFSLKSKFGEEKAIEMFLQEYLLKGSGIVDQANDILGFIKTYLDSFKCVKQTENVK